ncbi:MAG: tetratricopeptide repeat protein [Bacteroidaceae bacterium]|nr:tetratricopeptide repeat protein [Bacteroidaceae bacterium]
MNRSHLVGLIAAIGWLLPFYLKAQQTATPDSLYRWHVQHAMELLEVDSLAQAGDHLTEALRLVPSAPGNTLIYRYIAQIQERQGDGPLALQTLATAINREPANEQLLLDRAALNYRLGRNEHALQDYSAVLGLDDQNTEALFLRAHIYKEKRDYRSARTDYENLLRIQPKNMQAMVGLAMTNDADRRPVEAMEQMDVIVQLFPRDPLPWAIRGGMHQSRGQWEQALSDLTQAIELDPDNPDLYVSRATLFLAMNKRAKALQDARTAQRLGADAREMAGMFK